MKVKTSIVIPIFNEDENIAALYDELRKVKIAQIYRPLEFIFVDDGSTDLSAEVVREIAKYDERVRLIEFQRNFGKTAALDAGFRAARGNIIITMDADLQDNPAELGRMIDGLTASQMVCAWRANRAENDPLSKTLPSAIYNAVVRRMTGVNIHDFNCGYKAYRREVVENLNLYGELHRFIPVLAAWQGFTVSEIQVKHRPRQAGRSKFGAGRLLRGFLDFGTVLFLTRYLKQPMHLFGLAGVAALSAGALLHLYFAALWFIRAAGLADVPPIGTRPLFAIAVLALLFGMQLIAVGLIGEMIRFYAFKPEQEYTVRKDTLRDDDNGTDPRQRQFTKTSQSQPFAAMVVKPVSRYRH